MAIVKRNERYQVKLRGSDGKWMVQTVRTRKEAEQLQTEWKNKKVEGFISRTNHKMTVDEFFAEWFEDVRHESSNSGWRQGQFQYYRDYISPMIGNLALKTVSPAQIQRIFVEMTKKGKALSTQRLVYSTVRKLFGDAVETFQYASYNPVLRKLKPSIATKESRHLSVKEVVSLLGHVKDKKYGVAIWLQTFLGLRVSELQALRWSDLDLENGIVTIRRTYIRKTNAMRDYPKGRKQHSKSIPVELVALLNSVRPAFAADALVVFSPDGGGILPYRWYCHALKRYCRHLKIPVVSTHGLRHSTSELYLSHGANKEDLQELFAHSGMSVTERYIHNRESNLNKVAQVIKLF